jgi:hypothetical protein
LLPHSDSKHTEREHSRESKPNSEDEGENGQHRMPLSEDESENGQHQCRWATKRAGENRQHGYRWAREMRANRVRSRVCWLDALFIDCGCVSLWRCTYFPSMRLLSSVLGLPRRYPLRAREGRPQECVGVGIRPERGRGGLPLLGFYEIRWNF